MKLVGPAFMARFDERIVNTHPALSPSFPGMHAVRDALAYGVKVTGCTLFFSTTGVDTGPIVAQRCVPVLDGDDEATLHERIKIVERATARRHRRRDGPRRLDRHRKKGQHPVSTQSS